MNKTADTSKSHPKPTIDLPACWRHKLSDEFAKSYMKELRNFLVAQSKKGKVIYPKGADIFSALKLTPFKNVKVVIIGQDPYHGPGQAHGLSFSVRPGFKIPPSLKNIFKELQNDLGLALPSDGFLEQWAHQGVLLLNNVLSVEAGKPGSHRNKGWEKFTDRIVEVLNQDKENLVFLLWGRDARQKAQNVDRTKHFILESAHPSPFSATKFFGNHHFSKTNDFLKERNIPPINWQLP